MAKQYRDLPKPNPMAGPGGGIAILALLLLAALCCGFLANR